MKILPLAVAISILSGCTTEHSDSVPKTQERYQFGNGSLIYCWYVEGVSPIAGTNGFIIHDGKTGDIPVYVWYPFANLQDVGRRLREIGATSIVLAPYFPGVEEAGWRARRLTAEEEFQLGMEVNILEIQHNSHIIKNH